MNIVVCVKKVPEIDQVTIQDGIVTSSGAGMTNPFDMYAIEEAIRQKETQGGEITALTFGPENSDSALREALSLGADKAMRIWDDAAQNSDIAATAKILAAGIKKVGNVKLILFGKQAVDNDASSIAAATAGYLDFPQIMFVKKIREINEEKAVVERATEDGFDVVESSLPVVISVVKEINEPRLPSLKGKMKAKKAGIEVLSLSDIGLDAGKAGVSGSSSKLIESQDPPARPKGEMIEGSTPDEIADTLVAKLKDAKII
ncbi:MAG: electron transfer flavoprotein subunit beta/FixA family protein [candidate division Zixibacteria bacterium]|nr:electron transfer flavoprotein subunit beta/FixA family protein [candidate division Zixibacteria bacterium]